MTAGIISHARTFVVTPIRSMRKPKFTDVALVRGRWNSNTETIYRVAVYVGSNYSYNNISLRIITKKETKQIHRGAISFFTAGHITICEYIHFRRYWIQVITRIPAIESIYWSWNECKEQEWVYNNTQTKKGALTPLQVYTDTRTHTHLSDMHNFICISFASFHWVYKVAFMLMGL